MVESEANELSEESYARRGDGRSRTSIQPVIDADHRTGAKSRCQRADGTASAGRSFCGAGSQNRRILAEADHVARLMQDQRSKQTRSGCCWAKSRPAKKRPAELVATEDEARRHESALVSRTAARNCRSQSCPRRHHQNGRNRIDGREAGSRSGQIVLSSRTFCHVHTGLHCSHAVKHRVLLSQHSALATTSR